MIYAVSMVANERNAEVAVREHIVIDEGLVNERFELAALVFRLAGRPEFSADGRNYQRALIAEFSEFEDHAAVNFARNTGFGGPAVFNFAMHLQKVGNGFVLQNNLENIAPWSVEDANEFVVLLNDFYAVTNFSEFFASNEDYFSGHSARIIDNLHNHINFDWFAGQGFNPQNMRFVSSPSLRGGNYTAIVPTDVPGEYITYLSFPVTTSSTSFVNLHLATVRRFLAPYVSDLTVNLYENNADFRRMSEDSIQTNRRGWGTGEEIAGLYVGRIMSMIYMESHNIPTGEQMESNINNGLVYMREVRSIIESR
jgi:hypothetical protein